MEVTIRQVPAQPDIQEQQAAWLFHGTKYSVEVNPMKKVTIFVSLLLLLFLTACNARSAESDYMLVNIRFFKVSRNQPQHTNLRCD